MRLLIADSSFLSLSPSVSFLPGSSLFFFWFPPSFFLITCLQPTKLLYPWNSPGKNTGVGSHSLLQGIFLTQGLNLGLLHCRQILYCLSHLYASFFSRWTSFLFIFLSHLTFIYLFFKFYFIFKLYNIVLVLPNIEMNLPQVALSPGSRNDSDQKLKI